MAPQLPIPGGDEEPATGGESARRDGAGWRLQHTRCQDGQPQPGPGGAGCSRTDPGTSQCLSFLPTRGHRRGTGTLGTGTPGRARAPRSQTVHLARPLSRPIRRPARVSQLPQNWGLGGRQTECLVFVLFAPFATEGAPLAGLAEPSVTFAFLTALTAAAAELDRDGNHRDKAKTEDVTQRHEYSLPPWRI